MQVLTRNESPFERVAAGSSTVMASVYGGFFTVAIHLPDVAEQYVSIIEGRVQDIGWHFNEQYPVGVLSLLLSNEQGEALPIVAPICGSTEEFDIWGDSTRADNIIHLALIDSNSNAVATIRGFEIPDKLLAKIRCAARIYSSVKKPASATQTLPNDYCEYQDRIECSFTLN